MKKIILITGSSGSLGSELCKHFKKKYTVLCQTRNKLKKRNNKFLNNNVFISDLSNEKSVDQMYKEIKMKFTRIDYIICNAGKSSYPNFLKENNDDWIFSMKNNLISTVNTIQMFLKNFNSTDGVKIICISSIVADYLSDAPIAYSTAKAAQRFYVKSIVKKLAKYGITINSIIPGNLLIKDGIWDKKLKKNKKKINI